MAGWPLFVYPDFPAVVFTPADHRLHPLPDSYLLGSGGVIDHVRPLTSTTAVETTKQIMQCFEARRKQGGFMRHKIEMVLPDGSVATMIGGMLSGEGAITIAAKTYRISRSVMSDELRGLADYMTGGCFMGLPGVRLNDLEQKRSYNLRQRRIWSSTLDLLENEKQVGEFRSNCLQGRYRILVDRAVHAEIVLLCVWLIMVRMAFAA
jgi:hypothetical protein